MRPIRRLAGRDIPIPYNRTLERSTVPQVEDIVAAASALAREGSRHMATEVIMPKVDMVMETGTFVEWLKKEGDRVEKGEPLFIVLTDKANIEVEASAGGILAGLKAQPNDVIPVTEVIAYILEPGEALPAPAGAAALAAAAQPPVAEPPRRRQPRRSEPGEAARQGTGHAGCAPGGGGTWR